MSLHTLLTTCHPARHQQQVDAGLLAVSKPSGLSGAAWSGFIGNALFSGPILPTGQAYDDNSTTSVPSSP
jgi:hypothetical protein